MRFYFMGICGTAMGNAALLLKEMGHTVLGADSGMYPPMSDVLADAEVELFEGFDAERLARLEVDHVVVGNAMSRGNCEVEWLLNQSSQSFMSLPQLFHESILKERLPIVVSGTHGKTTTTTITAYLLEQAGLEPGWLIGGVPKDLSSGSKLGEGRPFVIEGDEYDSAFFDKRSKFIHYRPQIAIFNNLEFDHADIFRDLEDVLRTFRHFSRILPSSGYALVNGDDTNLAKLFPVDWTQVLTVGMQAEHDLWIRDFRDAPEGASFDLVWRGEFWQRVEWSLHGEFNARNCAMAALAAALATNAEEPHRFLLEPLKHFAGVQRRQDVLHDADGWVVLEDFAHHPTAVAGALEALRAAYPEHTLHVCFEPRSNTAASSQFQEEFTAALMLADCVYLGAVHRAERMRIDERLDTQRMAKALLEAGRESFAAKENAEILDLLAGRISEQESGVIVFLSNGSFDGIQRTVLKCL